MTHGPEGTSQWDSALKHIERLETQLKQIADLTAPAANSNCLCPYCQVYRIATKGPSDG